jgi:hypothetical protein
LDSLTAFINNIGKNISDAVESGITKMIDAVSAFISPIVKAIKDELVSVLNGVTTFITEQMSDIKEFFEGILDDVETFITGVLGDIYSLAESALNSVAEVVTDIREWIGKTFDTFLDYAQGVIDDVTYYIDDAFSTFSGLIESAYDELSGWIDETFGESLENLESIFTDVAQGITTVLDDSVDFLKSGFDGITSGVEAIVTEVVDSAESTIKSVGIFAKDLSASVGDLTESIKVDIQPIVKSLAESFLSSAVGIPADEVKEKAKDMSTAWGRTFDTMIHSEVGEKGWWSTVFGSEHTTTIGGAALSAFIIIFAQATLAAQVGQLSMAPKVEEFSQKVWESKPIMKLSVAEAATLQARGFLDLSTAVSDAQKHGYDEKRITAVMGASETPLDVERGMRALWRGLIDETTFENHLQRQGYNETDRQTLAGMSDIIPPVQDINSMAVRDVFSPEIADKFTLFSNVPDELKYWAKKQGLSEQWATYYWGAHWRLPSTNQGFEMFHRGVIDYETMQLLLRAVDIAPFWRDKLTKIAYNPVTRVDIRRMYKLGIIDEKEVIRRHLDLGYSPEDALSMTEFVKVYSGDDGEDPEVDLKNLTTSQVKTLAELGTISTEYAVDRLVDVGYSREYAQLIVDSWETSREINYRQDLINRATRKAIREGMTTSELEQSIYQLDLTPLERLRIEQVLALEAKETDSLPSKSELKKMYEGQVISFDVWFSSMSLMGYSDKWIDRYSKLYGFTGA